MLKRKSISKRKKRDKSIIYKNIVDSFIVVIVLSTLIILNGETMSLAADNINNEVIFFNAVKTSLESQKYLIKAVEDKIQVVENIEDVTLENASVEIEEMVNETINEKISETVDDTEAIFISNLNTSNKKIALTFDDCNNRANIEEILNILSENNVKATFFVTGDTINRFPDMLTEIVNRGNFIGNHSYSHSDFTILTSEEIKEEVETTEAAIKQITGESAKPMFRPPYGSFNDKVIDTLGDLGYTKFVYWSIDTRDWSGIFADAITDEVLSKAKPGSIVLLHASYGAKNTPAALPDIIKGLREQGYELVVFE